MSRTKTVKSNRPAKYTEDRIFTYGGGAHPKLLKKADKTKPLRKSSKQPLWNTLLQNNGTWQYYMCTKTTPIESTFANHIVSKMHSTKVEDSNISIWNSCMSQKGKQRKVGRFGEAFIYLMLKEAMPTLKTFKNTYPVFRDVEDNDPIDFSFFANNTFVHVCCKNSQKNMNYARTSKSFYHITDQDLQCPKRTLVIRVRFQKFDLEDPMGPNIQLQLLVQKNFTV